jgi:hypothetical protein
MAWMSDKEKELWKEHLARQERYLMGIDPIPEKEGNGSLTTDNKKWAWVIINEKRMMCWVDNVTMKAYKADGYNKTDIEIPEFKFERWCRGMDL